MGGSVQASDRQSALTMSAANGALPGRALLSRSRPHPQSGPISTIQAHPASQLGPSGWHFALRNYGHAFPASFQSVQIRRRASSSATRPAQTARLRYIGVDWQFLRTAKMIATRAALSYARRGSVLPGLQRWRESNGRPLRRGVSFIRARAARRVPTDNLQIRPADTMAIRRAIARTSMRAAATIRESLAGGEEGD